MEGGRLVGEVPDAGRGGRRGRTVYHHKRTTQLQLELLQIHRATGEVIAVLACPKGQTCYSGWQDTTSVLPNSLSLSAI